MMYQYPASILYDILTVNAPEMTPYDQAIGNLSRKV